VRRGEKSSDLQLGTVNYEACEGVRGLGVYLSELNSVPSTDDSKQTGPLCCSGIEEAFRTIEKAEAPLIRVLLKGLQSSSKVRIIGSNDTGTARIPVVSFVHQSIPSSKIVSASNNGGVICRNGTFLSSEKLQTKHEIDITEGVVRFSLAHYNTVAEVNYALSVLQSIPGWF